MFSHFWKVKKQYTGVQNRYEVYASTHLLTNAICSLINNTITALEYRGKTARFMLIFEALFDTFVSCFW